MKKNNLLILACILVPCYAHGEGLDAFMQKQGISLTGSIQSEFLIPQEDEEIGTEKTSDNLLNKTYAELNLTSNHVDAGVRFEYLEHPLPGFEKEYQGWGLPYFYGKIHFNKMDVTLGCFYEQFGSGFILRTYEERNLGIDNHLRGGRIVLKPYNGIQFKALAGKQRHYWETNDALLSGSDLELNIEQWFQGMQEKDLYLTLGGSWMNKAGGDTDPMMIDRYHQRILPEYANAFDARINLQKGAFSLLGEYAWKTQDPSYANNYDYSWGKVAMLSTSYAKKGMSLLLQAKRTENMEWRSDRNITGTSSMIIHQPAFTMDHTYALAAMYPYASKPAGEWAYQAEAGYNFKKHTLLGGEYGTNVKLNYSYVNAIAEDGAFLKWGDERFYQDLNLQLEKKISKELKLNCMYMNQFCRTEVTAERGEEMVHSNIFVAEGKYRFNRKYTLRSELQYLSTEDAQGDWAFALLELSMAPHWMLTVSDQWNCGDTDVHYYQGSATYNVGSHRIMAGYSRTRAGFNCTGGVCRYVPASKGFNLTYNYNF